MVARSAYEFIDLLKLDPRPSFLKNPGPLQTYLAGFSAKQGLLLWILNQSTDDVLPSLRPASAKILGVATPIQTNTRWLIKVTELMNASART